METAARNLELSGGPKPSRAYLLLLAAGAASSTVSSLCQSGCCNAFDGGRRLGITQQFAGLARNLRTGLFVLRHFNHLLSGDECERTAGRFI